MAFHPDAKQELLVDDVVYTVAEHPAARGIPYGQEGRQAVVYQLVAETDRRALKVFKPRYRVPALVSLADRIVSYAGMPGLQVCQRTVLTPQRHAPLLRQHPDLTYAVLMPWVEGPTWMEVLLERRALSPEESLTLARSLAEILAGMEQQGLAHCDLSGPNVLLPALLPSPAGGRGACPEQSRRAGGESGIALVDVEQLYGSDLRRPDLLPGGSPGYAHRTAPDGLWGGTADRFAGAVLLGETLGWCDGRVRETAWGENYFDPQEMQRESERYHTLVTVLQERWGDGVVRLFERVWRSDVLADCATFGEWLVTLPEEVPAIAPSPLPEDEDSVVRAEETVNAVHALMDLARQFEEQGKMESALETYRQAQALAPVGSGLAEELGLIVESLEAKQKARQKARQKAPAIPAPRPPFEKKGEKEPEVVTVSPPVATEEDEPDALFDDGLAAYRRGEWAKAKELLAEVVRQQPGYERDRQKASILLTETERQLVPSRRHVPGWAWVVMASVLVLLVVGGGKMLFPSRAPAPAAVNTRIRSADGKMMVYVPAGAFLMGSDLAQDPHARYDEQPQHEVYLSAFWIDRTEVTDEEYEACVRAGVCAPPAHDSITGYPAVGVDWVNARAYCQWVGGELPTEAQWEKAARGTDGCIYPWGNVFDWGKVNFCDAECPTDLRHESYVDGHEEVASVYGIPDGASPYGALNMAGNVWEWVLDCYNSEFYGTAAATGNDPVSYSSGCNEFVLRGGSWANDQHSARSANRYGSDPNSRGCDVGFRCVFPVTSP